MLFGPSCVAVVHWLHVGCTYTICEQPQCVHLRVAHSGILELRLPFSASQSEDTAANETKASDDAPKDGGKDEATSTEASDGDRDAPPEESAKAKDEPEKPQPEIEPTTDEEATLKTGTEDA